VVGDEQEFILIIVN
jgi:hypothetical protein